MRVAIIMPSGTLVHAHFAVSLAAMLGHLEGIQFALVNPRSSIVASSRNRGTREALTQRPDYLLYLDTDMSFPKDTLTRLLAADKHVVGCNYIMRNSPHKSLAWPKSGAKEAVSGVCEVARLPGGVMLVQASVFERIPRPWFEHPPTEDLDLLGEDYNFCDKARAAGFSIWMDVALSLQMIHWGDIGFRWVSGGFEQVETIGAALPNGSADGISERADAELSKRPDGD